MSRGTLRSSTATPNLTKKQQKREEEWMNNVRALTSPHVESFNYAIEHAIPNFVQTFLPVYFSHGNRNCSLKLEKLKFHKPVMPLQNDVKLYPWQARSGKLSYLGGVDVTVSITDIETGEFEAAELKNVTRIPVMVMSKLCNLHGMSSEELVKNNEEPFEAGGQFVYNGVERVLRLNLAPKRNYPFAVTRRAASMEHTKRIMIRGNTDGEIQYLNWVVLFDNAVEFTLTRALQFNVVLLLKALKKSTDREIFEALLGKRATSTNIDRVLNTMKSFRSKYPHFETPDELFSLIATQSYHTMGLETEPSAKVGRRIIAELLLPFLKSEQEKFDYIVAAVQKLFLFLDDEINVDEPESFHFIEVQSSGQLFASQLYDLFRQSLVAAAAASSRYDQDTDLFDPSILSAMVRPQMLTVLLGVGRLVNQGMYSNSLRRPAATLNLNGLSISADRISYYRYMSHFRAVHKGKRFEDMRTTTYRKLGTEEYGFICPVHTPDGGPCGLLNHFARDIVVIYEIISTETLPSVLSSLGMSEISDEVRDCSISINERVRVILNGKVIGYVRASELQSIANQLRYMKVKGIGGISKYLEIVPFCADLIRTVPCLLLGTDTHRIMRPVRNLVADDIEYITPLEQIVLNIAATPADIRPSTTHMDISPMTMLSVLGSLTPFSDFNQSPRNIYQCQMGKQSMSFPYFNNLDRIESKTYGLQAPQIPIVRNEMQEQLPFNAYANGTNAVVAVISYTGYDMEDAMIVNQSSFDRGFSYASMYKTRLIDLVSERKEYLIRDKGEFPCYFSNIDSFGNRFCTELDDDGLPLVGATLKHGDPLFCEFNEMKGVFQVTKYKETDSAIVDSVRLLSEIDRYGSAAFAAPKKNKAVVILKFNRNPTIGDKFASRHGQKGIMSMLWPQADMPFSENGIFPDIIINPHAFPSRMTIGMLVESMAGKSGAIHGFQTDSSPFTFDEDNLPSDYFGKQLLKAGYNYYGNETLYSGTTGVEMNCEIFMGVVFYQRMRHMVSDKFQARNSRGPIDSTTNQPVKGRKRGGGMRFGEMERDAILGYGASNVLRDRMLMCSDYALTYTCRQCGVMDSVIYGGIQGKCGVCDGRDIGLLEIPFPLRYLTSELAFMNINLKMRVQNS